MKKILVSACLLGCECRYDGKSKPCEKVLELAKKKDTVLIPVCPEQMGGLSTPRFPSERQRTARGSLRSISRPGAVLMNDGTDVSGAYRKGAEAALKIARIDGIDFAVLKSGSPSCGKGLIYDGTFSGKKTEGNGVTVELLLKEGYRVLSEEEL